MNLDWTSLVIGLIIGWLLEWIIDWLYWRKGDDAVDVSGLNAQVALLTGNVTDLETALAVARGEATHWEDKYVELEAECAGTDNLRAEIDALNARINSDRLRCIEKLTTLDGIDEEKALLLIDAGFCSPYDLASADPDSVRVALGYDENEFNNWWGRLALAGLAASTLTRDEEPMGMAYGADIVEPAAVVEQPMGMAFGADYIEEPELVDEAVGVEGQLAVEETIEIVDVDGDGGADLVVDRVITGLDLDGDTEIDVVLGETDDVGIIETAQPDDLTLIRGIGPAYGRKLNNAGIYTFAALAALSDDELQAILEPSVGVTDYNSLRSQAETFATVAPAAMQGDNLQSLEGIGPEYDRRLRAAGIYTFAQLAAKSPEELAEVIKAPAWRNLNYGAWITQAQLAAAGDDAGLKALQDQLFSRGSDNLLLIHGIGQSYNDALLAAGITSYSDLSTRSPETLAAIMADAGLRSADYEAWIEEAKLRAAGKRVPRAVRSYAEANVVSCPQDLEMIEGIGTVYEQRLYASGVGSYWEVSQLTDEQLDEILEAQDFQNVDTAEIRASAMRLAIETNSVNRVWDGSEPDDFEVFEGIGVVFERRLYNAGYCTYEALAAATVEALREACKPPKGQNPDFAGWIATAQILAAAKGAID